MTKNIWVSLAQTAFYGAVTTMLPLLISSIAHGGIVIPYGLTGIALWFLNNLENSIQNKTGNALFGAVSVSSTPKYTQD